MMLSRTFQILAHCLHLSFSLCNATDSTREVKKTDEEHAVTLIKWLEEENGYFNPKLQMRRVDPNDTSSHFGMFANESIEGDELMIRVPSHLILDSTEEDPDLDAMTCATVRNLIEQLKLKDDSKYAPYVNYILDTQPPGSIPSAWSVEGKNLLTRVLGGKKGDFDIPLPLAEDPFPWVNEWHNSCNGSDDPLEVYAALIVIQRSWDDILIPVFDMMSHRNGFYLNTASNNVHEGEDVEVTARRDIEAGEEIYTSYNMCEDCGARALTYGTPEILREYGFVEQNPQSWIFHDMELGFRIDEEYNENDEPLGTYGVTEWIFGEPDLDDVKQLTKLLEQVTKTKETTLSVRDENVPEFEWNTITNYIVAIETAIKVAINDYEDEGKKIPVLTEEDLENDYEYDEDEDEDEDDDGEYLQYYSDEQNEL